MATNNNQPSTGAWRPENNIPARQSDGEELVGRRVGEFDVFEAAVGAAVEDADTMVPGVCCVGFGLCLGACRPPKQKKSCDTIPLVGILWQV